MGFFLLEVVMTLCLVAFLGGVITLLLGQAFCSFTQGRERVKSFMYGRVALNTLLATGKLRLGKQTIQGQGYKVIIDSRRDALYDRFVHLAITVLKDDKSYQMYTGVYW